jgi:superfamily I DNA and/or RNA helicase
MHPEIRKFPSELFYHNQLTDGENIMKREKEVAFNRFKPFANTYQRSIFFDLTYSKEKEMESSRINEDESNFTFKLLQEYFLRI